MTSVNPKKKGMEELHKKGYCFIPNVVDVSDEVFHIVEQQAMKSFTIFNEQDGTCGDAKRYQCRLMARKLPFGFIEGIYAALKPFVGEERAISSISILRSDEGCQQQPFHRDYDPNQCKQLSDEQIPLAALIALERGTSLLCKVAGREKRLSIPKGSALVFRGDLIHAGSAYDDENHRLHVYIDSNVYCRPVPEMTYFA